MTIGNTGNMVGAGGVATGVVKDVASAAGPKPLFEGRSLKVSGAPSGGVPVETVSDAVRKSLTRDDRIGMLFNRAFRMRPVAPPPALPTVPPGEG